MNKVRRKPYLGTSISYFNGLNLKKKILPTYYSIRICTKQILYLEQQTTWAIGSKLSYALAIISPFPPTTHSNPIPSQRQALSYIPIPQICILKTLEEYSRCVFVAGFSFLLSSLCSLSTSIPATAHDGLLLRVLGAAVDRGQGASPLQEDGTSQSDERWSEQRMNLKSDRSTTQAWLKGQEPHKHPLYVPFTFFMNYMSLCGSIKNYLKLVNTLEKMTEFSSMYHKLLDQSNKGQNYISLIFQNN